MLGVVKISVPVSSQGLSFSRPLERERETPWSDCCSTESTVNDVLFSLPLNLAQILL